MWADVTGEVLFSAPVAGAICAPIRQEWPFTTSNINKTDSRRFLKMISSHFPCVLSLNLNSKCWTPPQIDLLSQRLQARHLLDLTSRNSETKKNVDIYRGHTSRKRFDIRHLTIPCTCFFKNVYLGCQAYEHCFSQGKFPPDNSEVFYHIHLDDRKLPFML